jgi:hypothetical protein
MAIFNSSSYQPLDAHQRQIRLLTIESHELKDSGVENALDLVYPDEATDDDAYTCILHTISLDDDTEYDALSYVWGDANDRMPIIVNDQIFLATRSLYEAIKGLHRKGAIEQHIWADAICINQWDLDERGQQVSIMGDIYRNAQNVHAWLGNASPATDWALEYLNTIDADTWGKPWTTEAEDKPFYALLALADRPWFTRLWVAQEVVLARRAWIHCGAQCTDLRSVVLCYRHYLLQRLDHRSAINLHIKRLGQLHSLHGILMCQDQTQASPKEIDGVYSLFEGTLIMGVSDPRDFVYALKGLLPSDIKMIPDYEASLDEVFQNATLSFIDWTKNLIWLECSAGPVPRQQCSLPSWAVHFPVESVRPKAPWLFNACRGFEAFVLHDSTGRMLKVAGRLCDEFGVGSAVSLLNPEDASGFRAGNLKALRGMRNFARDATVDTGESLILFQERFWAALCGWVLADQNDVTGRRHYKPYDRDGLDPSALDCYVMGDFDASDQQVGRWWLHLDIMLRADTRFCITTRGRFAMTKSSMRSGDKIAVLAGSRVPFVLRPLTQDAQTVYQVVAPCYCEGEPGN